MSAEVCIPACAAQEGLWFEERAFHLGQGYVVCFRFRITGPLDTAALTEAFRLVAMAHPALRSRFLWQGDRLQQRIAAGLTGPVVEMVTSEKELAWHRASLDQGPLLQARLLKCSPAEHLLWLGIHHIVFDGQSAAIFFRDLQTCYSALLAGSSPVVPGDDGYFRFSEAHSSRAGVGDSIAAARLEAKRFAKAGPLEFGTEHEEVPEFSGSFLERVLPGPPVHEVARLASSLRITRFILDTAIWSIVMSRFSGQPEFVLGSSVSLRDMSFTETVGILVNTALLKVSVGRLRDWTELVAATREEVVHALRNRSLPYPWLAAEANRAGLPQPLVQVMIGPSSAGHSLSRPGLRVVPERTDVINSPIQMDVALEENSSQIEVGITYSRRHLDAAQADRMINTYSAILHDLCSAEPGNSIDMLGRSRGRPRIPLRPAASHEPASDLVGLVDSGRPDLSLSSRLLAAVIDRMTEPDDHIGVLAPRGQGLATGVCAVWLSGRTCVLLSPDDRPERLAWVVDALDVTAVLVQPGYSHLMSGYRGRLVPIGSNAQTAPAASDTAVRRHAPRGVLLAQTNAADHDDSFLLVDDRWIANSCRDILSDPGRDWLAAELLPSMAHEALAQSFALAVHGAAADSPPANQSHLHRDTGSYRGRPGPEAARLVFPAAGQISAADCAVMANDADRAASGELGELVIHGDRVPLGYFSDPRATASLFTPDPNGTGARIFRTGLFARAWDDGSVTPAGPPRK